MMPMRNSTVKAFAPSNVSTTSCVGRIGVRLANTTNVANADSRAKTTATTPSTRADRPGHGPAALTSSTLAAWPTVVMDAGQSSAITGGGAKRFGGSAPAAHANPIRVAWTAAFAQQLLQNSDKKKFSGHSRAG